MRAPDTTCFFVYITTPGKEEARLIGQALVEERLAACANILDGMESVYRWDGTIAQDRETVLIAKTTGERLDALEAKVKELHSYDVPCIIAMPIASGSKEYLDWIREETRDIRRQT